MSEGSHWYRRDGSACFEVPNKSKAGTRPVRITDARELGLFPSVTTVLSILDKPQLTDWKFRQITRASFNAHAANAPLADYESYHSAIIDSAFQQVEDAADLGTAIHKALECHFRGESYSPALSVYVDAVDAWLSENRVEILESELRLTSVSHGFAGTTDAVFQIERPEYAPSSYGILDFKSRKTVPGKPVTPYDTQPMQIAAYDIARFGDRPTSDRIGCNLFISTTEPGRVEACWYDHLQLLKEWEALAHAMALWRHFKDYDPRLIA